MVSKPAFANSNPPVNGLLPIDKRTTSLVTFYFPVFPSNVTSTPFSLLFTPLSNLVFIMNLIPCFFNIFNNYSEISTSKNGQILSVCYTTVTSVPSLEYTYPISKPITPPPTTIMDLGIFFKSNAPVEVTTYYSSISNIPLGRVVGSLPVAIIMFFAFISYFPPSFLST